MPLRSAKSAVTRLVPRRARRGLAALLSLGMGSFALLSPAAAQVPRGEIEQVVRAYLEANPDVVGEIVRRYLAEHPEMLQQAIIDMMAKRGGPSVPAPSAPAAAAAPDRSAALKQNAALLFNSPRQVTLGNPAGDVTLVEFFDYNCGYCKRALGDTQSLLKEDPKLRIVLKELPILGPGSAEAARIGVALAMQDPSGEKSRAYHEALLGARGQANRAAALKAAAATGADMARLEQDVSSPEIDKTLAESRDLARALGINGTPAYVLANTVIPGAVGLAGLKEAIAAARRP
ncbi:DsbA family protein [Aquabacter cavernae]|uniref:DsbA family protein n=1 Tax=Aquabacter cavernae TaxID=2496029 RepID=UPI001FE1B8E1|nr:DsbA family protein [Aquabacter cavernae]